MAVRHFLAYGNSDQESFRTEDVRACFDFLTVPGTIGTYYAEATAAFVLSSGLDYMIDPRTPLFQEYVSPPRASHYTLAAALSSSLHHKLVEGATNLGAEEFSSEILEDMIESFVAFQKGYPQQAESIESKIDRYQALLAQARGLAKSDLETGAGEFRKPSFILLPYFATRRVGDDWWELNREIWRLAAARGDRGDLSPVLVVSSVSDLDSALHQLPDELSNTVMFWITNLDEREVQVDTLSAFWQFFVDREWPSVQMINLYGGYFSVCLGRVGLWGFNNGLGYSESRGWPELAATGAAPPRYYVPELHMFLSQRGAQSLIEMEPDLACLCRVCREAGGRVDTLSYHGLKAHFALSRKWEIEFAADCDMPELGAQMREAALKAEAASDLLPGRLRPAVDFLHRWASVVAPTG